MLTKREISCFLRANTFPVFQFTRQVHLGFILFIMRGRQHQNLKAQCKDLQVVCNFYLRLEHSFTFFYGFFSYLCQNITDINFHLNRHNFRRKFIFCRLYTECLRCFLCKQTTMLWFNPRYNPTFWILYSAVWWKWFSRISAPESASKVAEVLRRKWPVSIYGSGKAK